MGQLTTYQTQVSRLLHDPLFQYWPQTELTDYINEARNRAAQDSKCLRQLITGLALTAQTELYVPQTFLGSLGPNLVDVMGITIYWGTMRIKLAELSFTNFDAKFRRYQVYYGRPVAFTRLGANNVLFGPNPDQAYITDWDVSVIPPPLVLSTDIETMPVPFIEPVQYYAAFKAKFKEQALGEANIFLKQYAANMGWSQRSYRTRTIPNPYRIGA